VRPTPLAIGLLGLAPHASQAERTKARIALALRAADGGYALVETFETDGGDRVKEDAAFTALEELAERMDAQAVICGGVFNRHRVEQVAWRARLVVIG
jgi:hypothetical protein